MDNFKKVNELKIFLEVDTEFKGLEIYSTDIEDEVSAIDMMKEGLDFDDALQSYIATKLGVKIVSFDKHFDKVKGLDRVTPKDIVKNSNGL
ncbi:MAG TPA: type II toxin-antitoxin system VapC family toxin [Methanomicrobia archaeon]|nr:type II toxin-antitoxin system VapC family toxin [Methanomicrobia archaeon]